jgi:lysozyme family protein
MNLDDALEFLLDEEGGWSNHPADRGGATMYGITQKAYDSWRRKKKRTLQSVRLVSKDEARELYEEEYWLAASCHKLPWPISYLCFDAAVNSGPLRGKQWVQTGLGVKADGAIGPASVAAAELAVKSGDAGKLLGIVDARATFLARLVQKTPSQAAFLLGWWRRTLRVLARSLTSET